VLVSEVMLQQTQVERVIPYFEAFTARFPHFEALASATRSEVIQVWAGLGYNRRAVQLHALARCVVAQHGGELPRDRRALLDLPGIGPYTAGAVLSIAFGQDEPALDTNVRRVILRLAFEPAPTGAPSSRELEAAARRFVPPGRAGDWNQALMDLGSAICVERRPRCLLCPLQEGCRSAGRVSASRVPGGRKPADAYQVSTRYYRGRLLSQLRSLPAGAIVPLGQVAERLEAHGVAEPPAGWATVAEALARDGLARIEHSVDGMRAGLA
jgi:A/G-specific adenine glycosylase